MHTTPKPTPPQTPDAIGRRQLLGAAAATALALVARPGQAQAAFPAKPITIIVPYTAGARPTSVPACWVWSSAACWASRW